MNRGNMSYKKNERSASSIYEKCVGRDDNRWSEPSFT